MILSWMYRWWTNRQRQLFRYWDGRRFVRADPLVIHQRLSSHPSYSADLFKKLGTPRESGRIEAITAIAEMASEVFAVPRLNETGTSGLSIEELAGLLLQFHEYVNSLKKNMPPLSALQPSTGGQPSPDFRAENPTSSPSPPPQA